MHINTSRIQHLNSTLSGAPYACCFHSADECVDIVTTSGCHNGSSFEDIPVPSGAWNVHEKIDHLPSTETDSCCFMLLSLSEKVPSCFGHLHRLCAQHLQVLMPHKRLRHLVFQACCARPTRGCLMFDDTSVFGRIDHHWPSLAIWPASCIPKGRSLSFFKAENPFVIHWLRCWKWFFVCL